jgi:hypothetical protein
MVVNVRNCDFSRRKEIKEAAGREWAFDGWWDNEWHDQNVLSASGDDNLYDADGDEGEFARRLAKAIFEANGRPCEVEVLATCLEDLPHETYYFGPSRLP